MRQYFEAILLVFKENARECILNTLSAAFSAESSKSVQKTTHR
ncbi:hypothetical protein [Helicobacter bilis]|nr:hypothetical protein [Helicobacter bilis]